MTTPVLLLYSFAFNMAFPSHICNEASHTHVKTSFLSECLSTINYGERIEHLPTCEIRRRHDSSCRLKCQHRLQDCYTLSLVVFRPKMDVVA